MSEIAGDAFFLSLLYKKFSRAHNHAPYSGGVNTPPVLTPSPLCGSNYQITKSQAFETKYYGHPVVAATIPMLETHTGCH